MLQEGQVDRARAQGVSFQVDETTHFVARMLNQVVFVAAMLNPTATEEGGESLCPPVHLFNSPFSRP